MVEIKTNKKQVFILFENHPMVKRSFLCGYNTISIVVKEREKNHHVLCLVLFMFFFLSMNIQSNQLKYCYI